MVVGCSHITQRVTAQKCAREAVELVGFLRIVAQFDDQVRRQRIYAVATRLAVEDEESFDDAHALVNAILVLLRIRVDSEPTAHFGASRTGGRIPKLD